MYWSREFAFGPHMKVLCSLTVCMFWPHCSNSFIVLISDSSWNSSFLLSFPVLECLWLSKYRVLAHFHPLYESNHGKSWAAKSWKYVESKIFFLPGRLELYRQTETINKASVKECPLNCVVFLSEHIFCVQNFPFILLVSCFSRGHKMLDL